MGKMIGVFFLLAFLPFHVAAKEIVVAAAANVQYVLEELRVEFKKNTGIELKIITSPSGRLTAQIENGAPFDIFLSADTKYPEFIYKKGLAYQPPKIYAYGQLVLWTMKDVDLSKGVEVVADSSVRKIAVANPKTAPYGQQAVNAMAYYKLHKAVERKLVFGGSIAHVNQFIFSRAVDVGFTAKSSVLAPNVAGKGKWIEVDPKAYHPIAQGAVILRHAQEENFQAAKQFYDFLFSDKAKEIFKKFGYTVP